MNERMSGNERCFRCDDDAIALPCDAAIAMPDDAMTTMNACHPAPDSSRRSNVEEPAEAPAL